MILEKSMVVFLSYHAIQVSVRLFFCFFLLFFLFVCSFSLSVQSKLMSQMDGWSIMPAHPSSCGSVSRQGRNSVMQAVSYFLAVFFLVSSYIIVMIYYGWGLLLTWTSMFEKWRIARRSRDDNCRNCFGSPLVRCLHFPFPRPPNLSEKFVLIIIITIIIMIIIISSLSPSLSSLWLLPECGTQMCEWELEFLALAQLTSSSPSSSSS